MNNSDFGLIGLGVMGKSISLNLADNGFSVSVYNRTEANEAHIVSSFINKHSSYKNLNGFTELKAFVLSLSKPRKIMLMIKAGDAVDSVISQLISCVDEGDIIIDGGNSFYLDTVNRFKHLAQKNIHYIGCGISGGEEGARKGPSLMPGGDIEAYKSISHILEKIAAKDKSNNPCCTYTGNDGSGHFVKMVHNGIEYAEMQLLAEIYSILSKTHTKEEIVTILSYWNNSTEASYLLEITINILQKKDSEGFILDRILDKALSKGTGSWSSKAALKMGIPSTMISSAVFSRYISAFKEQRKKLSTSTKEVPISRNLLSTKQLEKAYSFARIINHQQGFQLIAKASKTYNWSINLSEIARIWTNGCIIRSKFMESSVEIFKNHSNFFEDKNILKLLSNLEDDITNVLHFGLSNRIALDSFYAAYNYWIAMTTKNSSANLIQAQRDYFGAHTYQRIDKNDSEFFHTNWKLDN